MMEPVLPPPLTTLMTPGGNPASLMYSPKAIAPSGDFSEALKTKVLPAATAGAIFLTAVTLFQVSERISSG